MRLPRSWREKIPVEEKSDILERGICLRRTKKGKVLFAQIPRRRLKKKLQFAVDRFVSSSTHYLVDKSVCVFFLSSIKIIVFSFPDFRLLHVCGKITCEIN